MFKQLVHADWSTDDRKRWAASAVRTAAGWQVSAPVPVGPPAGYLNSAFAAAEEGSVLLGFDFPIGLPQAYGSMTRSSDFLTFIGILDAGGWRDFFSVSDRPSEISIGRPFYPRTSRKGVSRAELVVGLGVRDFNALLRVSERATDYRQAACSIFWTLGGNQVGKAALAGWRDIVMPARRRGAMIWPFEGDLATLAAQRRVVIAETYPAEAYRLVGAGFAPGESKRSQSNRRRKADAILDWAAANSVQFDSAARDVVIDGFGPRKAGEDPFDALLGLLKMIEVVDGRRPEATLQLGQSMAWEGWILAR